MFKTVKGKILVGALVLSLVGGIGSAFAATDVGSHLQAWYNAKFSASSQAIASVTSTYAGNELTLGTPKSNAYFKQLELRGDKVVSVFEYGVDQTASAIDNVNQAKYNYIATLDLKKNSIVTGMPGQFAGVVNGHNSQIDAYVADKADSYVNHVGRGLATFINAAGSYSSTTATTNINVAADQAKQDLNDAIDAAKSHLEGLIATQQSDAITDINDHTNVKIAELITTITTAANTLEADNKALIDAAASAAEAAALAELANLVSGLNP